MSALVDLRTSFVGQRGRLFWLAVRTSILTVLTLGIYRFWMKTRLRRYYWSSIRPGGHPLEYVGEPLEKLLGFLIAVVFLAFYIGIVNLILMFLSFALLQDNFAAYALSFVGIVPVLFYAQYRARRYILARTRWRGIRFGVQPGAWGYAGRTLVHWGLTIISLGLLWPRMTFWLEKYRADRTTYGSATITQGGSWGMLYSAYLPGYIGGLITAGCLGVSLWFLRPELALGLIVGVPLLLIGAVHYWVASFRLLTNTKSADGVGFTSVPRSRRVFWIYGFGHFLAVLVISLGATVVVLAGAALFEALMTDSLVEAIITNAQVAGPLYWAAVAAGIVLYFLFFVTWGALRHIFVTLPLMRHYAETLTITGAAGLLNVRQSDRDRFAEAEGFAEALDIGAAI